MRAGLILLLAAGCGGSTKPQPTPVTTPPPTTAGSGATPTAPTAPTIAATDVKAVCKRVMDLKASRCGEFAALEIDENQCVTAFKEAGADPTAQTFINCVIQPSCEEVKGCMQAASESAQQTEKQDLRACTDPPGMDMKAVGLPPVEYNKRNGAGVTKYSQAKSTKALPIEMCGVRDENAWLVSLTCNDTSHPIMDAETARVGNVGSGGRCGSIIDKYAVKCPEKTYDIFIDAYVCPKQ
ncbi:MAG: hypothetical protein IPQ07_29185 [Myxococcales bacterium]|nr:hypothetical protein [Myxococcales bacterium]